MKLSEDLKAGPGRVEAPVPQVLQVLQGLMVSQAHPVPQAPITTTLDSRDSQASPATLEIQAKVADRVLSVRPVLLARRGVGRRKGKKVRRYIMQ